MNARDKAYQVYVEKRGEWAEAKDDKINKENSARDAFQKCNRALKAKRIAWEDYHKAENDHEPRQ